MKTAYDAFPGTDKEDDRGSLTKLWNVGCFGLKWAW